MNFTLDNRNRYALWCNFRVVDVFFFLHFILFVCLFRSIHTFLMYLYICTFGAVAESFRAMSNDKNVCGAHKIHRQTDEWVEKRERTGVWAHWVKRQRVIDLESILLKMYWVGTHGQCHCEYYIHKLLLLFFFWFSVDVSRQHAEKWQELIARGIL